MQAKRGKGNASIEAQVVVEKTAQAQKDDQLRLFMGPPIFPNTSITNCVTVQPIKPGLPWGRDVA